MQKKNFNDGLVGNKKLKASFTKNGELIRLLYGQADFKQFLQNCFVGIKINDSNLIYLHEDINNRYSQYYIEDTNVLVTEIRNTYFNVKVTQTDFVPLSDNVLIKNYVIKNESSIDYDLSLFAYLKLLTDMNNDTSGFVKNNTLIQYNHDFSICTFSDKEIQSYQVNNSLQNLKFGVIGSKDYIGMSPDSAIGYSLGKLHSGEETSINLFIYVNKNRDLDLISELDKKIEYFKALDVNKLKEDTIKYWRRFLVSHDENKINELNIDEKIKRIYNRSILLFQLLIEEDTGGISAGIEIDEHKMNCGRYSFCWPRDGVFVTEALNLVGFDQISEKFYKNFCKKTQFPDGRWEQRYYTDLRLAPSWGYQIDETCSVVFGTYAHYKSHRDKQFIIDNLEMNEKAISFIKKYTDDILNGERKMQKSYDLWEEHEGDSLYSFASIYAAFSAMKSMYREVTEIYQNENNSEKLEFIKWETEKLDTYRRRVTDFAISNFYDNDKKSFVRNPEDKKMDVSIIGIVNPFHMFDPGDSKIKTTVDRMEFTLRTFTGGFVRYEHDNYMGGYNPWPIATLWMAWYYMQVNDTKKALECFWFVVNSASNVGLLGEQVDNKTMKPSWVIGLTWSHAMFIITLDMMLKKGLL